MSDVEPAIEWRFPNDEDEDKSFHTSGALPNVGDVVNVYVGNVAGPSTDARYVVERIEWTIFDKRKDKPYGHLDVFAIVVLKAAQAPREWCGKQWGGGETIHVCDLEKHEGPCHWPGK